MVNKDEDPVLYCLATVSRHFNDGAKATEWLNTPINGKTPRDMLKNREFDRVIKLVEENLLSKED